MCVSGDSADDEVTPLKVVCYLIHSPREEEPVVLRVDYREQGTRAETPGPVGGGGMWPFPWCSWEVAVKAGKEKLL